MANVVFQDIQICIYDVDGKEAAEKLDKYFEFASDHPRQEKVDSHVSFDSFHVPMSMPQSHEMGQSLIDPINPRGTPRTAGHLRRQSSDAGDGNSVLLKGLGAAASGGDFSQQMLMSEPKTYGSMKRENRLPRLPRKVASRHGDSFENNSPDAGDQSSLLLAKGPAKTAITFYGSDDVIPTASGNDEGEKGSRDIHPLLLP